MMYIQNTMAEGEKGIPLDEQESHKTAIPGKLVDKVKAGFTRITSIGQRPPLSEEEQLKEQLIAARVERSMQGRDRTNAQEIVDSQVAQGRTPRSIEDIAAELTARRHETPEQRAARKAAREAEIETKIQQLNAESEAQAKARKEARLQKMRDELAKLKDS